MSQTQTVTNGDSKSRTLEHLGQYPIVTDGINTFKSYPLGAKSIEIADAAYARVGKPLEPHLRTPYSYARPYVNKADSLADQALSHVDNHLPIVKEDTDTVIGSVKDAVFFPLRVVGSGKDYLTGVYSEEYKRTAKRWGKQEDAAGLIVPVAALVYAEFHVASDALQYAADWFNTNKGDLEATKDKVVNYAKDTKDQATKKTKEVSQQAEKKTKEASQQAEKKTKEATS